MGSTLVARTRGKVARHQGHYDQHNRNRRVRHGIGGSDGEEETRHQPRTCKCSGNANPDTDQRQTSTLPHDQPHNIVLPRAERHPDSDFSKPLRHAIRNHSINSHNAKKQRERRKIENSVIVDRGVLRDCETTVANVCISLRGASGLILVTISRSSPDKLAGLFAVLTTSVSSLGCVGPWWLEDPPPFA